LSRLPKDITNMRKQYKKGLTESIENRKLISPASGQFNLTLSTWVKSNTDCQYY